jgi:intracellular septation protein A
MNRKIKYSMASIGILGVLFGRFLNRELTHYFGNNASNIIVAICLAVIFCVILLSIIMKQYITGIGLFVISIPLIVGGLGLYLDNMELVGLGILLIFIIYPAMIIVIKRFRNNS